MEAGEVERDEGGIGQAQVRQGWRHWLWAWGCGWDWQAGGLEGVGQGLGNGGVEGMEMGLGPGR